MRERIRAVLAVTALAGGVVIVTPTTALASCIEPPPFGEAIEQATTVFVGTVIHTEYRGRVATFHVNEVWKGSVPPVVVVNGGPPLETLENARANGMDVHLSVERSFDLGATYVVFPYPSDDGVLVDNVCSNTREFTAELAAFRPETATSPTLAEPPTTSASTPEESPTSNIGWWLTGAAALLALATATTLLTKKRNT